MKDIGLKFAAGLSTLTAFAAITLMIVAGFAIVRAGDAVDAARTAVIQAASAAEQQSVFNEVLIRALREQFREHERNVLVDHRQGREAFRPLLIKLAEHIGLTEENITGQFEQADEPTGKKGGGGKGSGNGGGGGGGSSDDGPPPQPPPDPPGSSPPPEPQCVETPVGCIPTGGGIP